jgi:hypothetical protein
MSQAKNLFLAKQSIKWLFLQKLACYPSFTFFMDCFFASLIAMTEK